jgi:hypothetical protein
LHIVVPWQNQGDYTMLTAEMTILKLELRQLVNARYSAGDDGRLRDAFVDCFLGRLGHSLRQLHRERSLQA